MYAHAKTELCDFKSQNSSIIVMVVEYVGMQLFPVTISHAGTVCMDLSEQFVLLEVAL